MTTNGLALSESVTVARLRLLTQLKTDGPKKVSKRYLPRRWALERGLVREDQGLTVITPEGMAKLSYAQLDGGLKRAIKALPHLSGKVLLRTASDTDEAIQLGGGYLYTTEPDHRPFPTATARILIGNGMLVARKDGLIDGMSQTFALPRGA